MQKADRLPLQPITPQANPFDDILFDIGYCGMHKFSGALLDDILIFSTTWSDHLKHV